MHIDSIKHWLQSVMITCLVVMALTGAAIVLGVTIDVKAGVKEQRDARCLNSLCEYPCKPGQRFVKNQGCLK